MNFRPLSSLVHPTLLILQHMSCFPVQFYFVGVNIFQFDKRMIKIAVFYFTLCKCCTNCYNLKHTLLNQDIFWGSFPFGEIHTNCRTVSVNWKQIFSNILQHMQNKEGMLTLKWKWKKSAGYKLISMDTHLKLTM